VIENLLIHVCTIWRKKTYSTTSDFDGADAAADFNAFSIDEPCLVRFVIPRDETGKEYGNSEIIMGTLRIKTELLISDRLEYDGYFYKITGVQKAQNFITEEVEYYTADMERERVATLNDTLVIS